MISWSSSFCFFCSFFLLVLLSLTKGDGVLQFSGEHRPCFFWDLQNKQRYKPKSAFIISSYCNLSKVKLHNTTCSDLNIIRRFQIRFLIIISVSAWLTESFLTHRDTHICFQTHFLTFYYLPSGAENRVHGWRFWKDKKQVIICKKLKQFVLFICFSTNRYLNSCCLMHRYHWCPALYPKQDWQLYPKIYIYIETV